MALEEGGTNNGVLTAVEDFLAETRGLDYRQVDAVFGVGYVFAAGAPYADELRELLRPWHENRLLKRLERDRVRLFARMIELDDELRHAGMNASRASLSVEDRIEALEAENAALRLERQRLKAQLAGNGSPAPPS